MCTSRRNREATARTSEGDRADKALSCLIETDMPLPGVCPSVEQDRTKRLLRTKAICGDLYRASAAAHALGSGLARLSHASDQLMSHRPCPAALAELTEVENVMEQERERLARMLDQLVRLAQQVNTSL